MSIETTFQKLKKRTPSNEERLILHELKDTYGIDENDPMWAIVFAFGFHVDLYKKIPGAINNQRLKTLEAVKEQAEIVARERAKDIADEVIKKVDAKIKSAIKQAATGSSTGERIFYSVLTSCGLIAIGVIITLSVIMTHPDYIDAIRDFFISLAGK